MPQYIAHSYAMQTAGPPTLIAVAAATMKTLLQVQTPSTRYAEILGWGFDFDGAVAAAPVSVELIDTAAIAATMTTAHVASGVQPLDGITAGFNVASLVTLGTGATGFNASAEGTIVASRSLDTPQYPPSQPYAMWFPEGRLPAVGPSRNFRVRARSLAAAPTVNMSAWVAWRE